MRDTFLRSGRVGRDLLGVDWAATALGPTETWPRSLQAVVRLVLSSRFSMWMAWGEDLTFFCNDAYRQDTLGAKYPWALGKPAAVVWSEVWPDVAERVDRVLTTGVATWDEKLLLFLERNGYREETYHTFSYSPLAGDSGAVAGLLCVVREDTEEVISRRRTAALRDTGVLSAGQLTEAEVLSELSRALGADSLDVAFLATYLEDADGVARLAGSAGFSGPHPAIPATVAPGDPDRVWPRPVGDLPVVVDGLAQRWDDLPAGGWKTAPDRAAVVPITGAHSTAYGFLVVGLNPFRPFDAAYAEFLQLVAARFGAALAVARASVQAATEVAAREHEIADALQRSLLPRPSFDLRHLEVATYYRAGVAGTQVGGDWYDVIELGESRTALVVGDVMGRGVSAAALMGQVRAAVRAYARLGLPPQVLLESVDAMVRDLAPDQIVTCVYAVFDPADLVLRYANAGHLPLLVRYPDGSTVRLSTDPHPPLGFGTPFATTQEVHLAPGSSVFLYTDGLVERRGEDLETGIDSLIRVVASLDVPLAELPAAVVRSRLTGEVIDDDVAVLVARVPASLSETRPDGQSGNRSAAPTDATSVTG